MNEEDLYDDYIGEKSPVPERDVFDAAREERERKLDDEYRTTTFGPLD